MAGINEWGDEQRAEWRQRQINDDWSRLNEEAYKRNSNEIVGALRGILTVLLLGLVAGVGWWLYEVARTAYAWVTAIFSF